jgi:hypothetical protein
MGRQDLVAPGREVRALRERHADRMGDGQMVSGALAKSLGVLLVETPH